MDYDEIFEAFIETDREGDELYNFFRAGENILAIPVMPNQGPDGEMVVTVLNANREYIDTFFVDSPEEAFQVGREA